MPREIEPHLARGLGEVIVRPHFAQALVEQLKDWGLDASSYYPKYRPDQQAFYLYLAEKYRLR